MRALRFLLFLLFASSGISGAQGRGLDRELVARGMAARLTRGGVYPPVPGDLRDTSVSFYPSVRFYYTDVALEHGGHFRLYSAVDSTGQLYLLDSPASFRLLHESFFRGSVDSTTAIAVALLAARFGGLLPAEYHLRRAEGFLMKAVSADGTSIPWAWRVTLDVQIDDGPEKLKYDIRIRDGNPAFYSRKCSQWCRTTILEP